MITMITGGARSGKSTFAESIYKDKTNVIYIACAVVTDDEMRDRVAKHKLQRPDAWCTLEAYNSLTDKLQKMEEYKKCEYLLLDCITTMVTNFMVDANIDYDTCTLGEVTMLEESIINEIDDLLDEFTHSDKHLIIVTNEVGLGIVPAYRMARFFRDIAGRCNQLIAKKADYVYLVTSGIPQKLK